MVQAPPLALVHEVFGEFLTDAAGIQPAPDTFDFVLKACAMLADFHLDEKIRQQLFNSPGELPGQGHLQHQPDRRR